MAGLWSSKVEKAIGKSQSTAKSNAREISRQEFDTAVDYAEDNMLQDTIAALQMRYPAAQEGGRFTGIQPVTVPIVARYLDEAATAYTRGVYRTLVDAEGNPDEELTKELATVLDDVGYDLTLNKVERYAILLKSCGLWVQDCEDEPIEAIPYLPQDIYPISEGDSLRDPAAQKSYLGFILAERQGEEDVGSPTLRTYTAVGAEGFLTFRSTDPHQLGRQVTETKNPYKMQMLTIWHPRKPAFALLPDGVPSIFTLNREINVLWSVLLDIMRFQGGALLTQVLADPQSVTAKRAVGVRHPWTGHPGESAHYESASNDFAGLVSSLQAVVKLVMLSLRQSPSDFSLEGAQIASGFAKIIDSIPKVEARDERIKWFSIMERRTWSRLAAVLVAKKILPEKVKGYRLQVEYDGIRIPEAIQERIAREKHEIELGLTTAAEILAEQNAITIDQAREQIRANKQENRSGAAGASIAGLVNASAMEEEPEETEEEELALQ